ncbi:C2 calcium-dependent membrane targeting [Corchorus capsularis]|uniref:C2 calcium-dependent membrane targeting n=1 Tax=Corchorus capsularis TaxID=210143 RepID=A0A1R3JUP2_COCAP|nr:C2 calcium-dependent membrane targeting [Corchorus capsularis]
MESSFIEIKVISCKDLKAFNFFQKLSVYALVSIARDDDKKVDEKQQQRTPTDREGDGNPEWNHTVRFDLSKALLQDLDNLLIHFDLRHEGLMFGYKTIGEVRVPLKDLIQESNGVVRFVIYEVVYGRNRNPRRRRAR